MNASLRRATAALSLTLALLMLLVSMPVVAVAPGPVVAVDPDEDVTEEGGPAEEQPSAPDYADDPACLLPAAASAPSAAMPGIAGSGRLTSYPGPVVPVDRPQLPPCRTELALSLLVVSPDDSQPEGADAYLDGQTVPRATLESGYSAELVAGTRTISLSDPGWEWKVMDVACTCDGGAGGSAAVAGGNPSAPAGRLTSYPGPVVAVGRANEPPGARPGTAMCPGRGTAGASASGGGQTSATSGGEGIALSRIPVADADAWPAPGGGPGARLLQPGPVVAIEDPGGEVVPPAPEPTPEPPAREPGFVEWFPNGDIFVYDPDGAGGAFSCTWTVEHGRGLLTLDTRTTPPGRADRFRYVATPSLAGLVPETIRGSSPGQPRQLWKGLWTVEAQQVSEAWELEASDCSETDGTTPSSAQGAVADAGVDPGDQVTCTFEWKLLAPKPGTWRARNAAGRVSCGGVSLSLPEVTDTGTIRVRNGGLRLIARGLSRDSDTTWRLDREDEDSLRYSGSVRLSLGGARGTFRVELDLVDEKTMRGQFSGDVRVRGERCSFSRGLRLQHVGG